jgi:translation initiation factor 2B subunit (eIF-2B alpha/beta/delta family)
MAPLLNLANGLLLALERGGRDPVSSAARAARAFALGLSRDRKAIAARAARLVPAHGPVAVHSWSSTVTAALVRAGRRRSLEVVCSESRPGLEGRRTAATLARAGLRVRLLPDLAFLDAAAEADLFLVGADALSAFGLVNKAGTCAAARRIREGGGTVLALADSSKVLPSVLAARLRDRPGPAREVWPRPARGVRIESPTFDTTPLALLSSVVTPLGARPPVGVVAEAERRPVAGTLLHAGARP